MSWVVHESFDADPLQRRVYHDTNAQVEHVCPEIVITVVWASVSVWYITIMEQQPMIQRSSKPFRESPVLRDMPQ